MPCLTRFRLVMPPPALRCECVGMTMAYPVWGMRAIGTVTFAALSVHLTGRHATPQLSVKRPRGLFGVRAVPLPTGSASVPPSGDAAILFLTDPDRNRGLARPALRGWKARSWPRSSTATDCARQPAASATRSPLRGPTCARCSRRPVPAARPNLSASPPPAWPRVTTMSELRPQKTVRHQPNG